MAEPTIRAEVATAFRRIAAEYSRLPFDIRENLDLNWNGADELLDRTLLDGDRDAAIAAIRSWENFYFEIFEKATR